MHPSHVFTILLRSFPNLLWHALFLFEPQLSAISTWFTSSLMWSLLITVLALELTTKKILEESEKETSISINNLHIEISQFPTFYPRYVQARRHNYPERQLQCQTKGTCLWANLYSWILFLSGPKKPKETVVQLQSLRNFLTYREEYRSRRTSLQREWVKLLKPGNFQDEMWQSKIWEINRLLLYREYIR